MRFLERHYAMGEEDINGLVMNATLGLVGHRDNSDYTIINTNTTTIIQ